MSIKPTPSDEEAAAIVAALQIFLNSGGSAGSVAPIVNTSWRFSGRGWSSQRFGSRTTG